MKKAVLLFWTGCFCLALTASLQAQFNRTQIGGTATSSNTDSPGAEGAAQAFDDNDNTKWLTFTALPQWIQYQFPDGKQRRITSYWLTSANDAPGRDPRIWTFEGSNDGTTWDILDSKNAAVDPNSDFPERFFTRKFNIDPNFSYEYYRLNMSANNGDGLTQLAEVRLFDSDPLVFGQSPANGTDGLGLSVDLSWQAESVSGGATYDVLLDVLDPNAEPTTVIANDITTTSFTATGLNINTEYMWKVIVDDGGETDMTGISTFKTGGLIRNPVPSDCRRSVATDGLFLRWDGDAVATSYDVYFGDSAAAVEAADTNSPEFQGNVTVTEWAAPSLADGVTRYWRVDERDDNGVLVPGMVFKFTTGTLLGCWNLDGNLLDSSGNGNHGTVENAEVTNPTGGTEGGGSISYIPGISGMAMNIPAGEAMAVIPIGSDPNNSFKDTLEGFTVAAWIKPNDTHGTWVAFVSLLGEENAGWALRRFQWFLGGSMTTRGTSGPDDARGAASLFDGKWHLVVATWDGFERKLFVDGRLDCQEIGGANSDYSLADTGIINDSGDTNIAIGGQLNSDNSAGRYMHGAIDEVKIWSKALPDSEVIAMMTASSPAAYNLAPDHSCDPLVPFALDDTFAPTLSWTKSTHPDAAGYNVVFAESNNDFPGFVDSSIATTIDVGDVDSYTFTMNLKPGTTYAWGVETYDGTDTVIGQSDCWDFTTPSLADTNDDLMVAFDDAQNLFASWLDVIEPNNVKTTVINGSYIEGLPLGPCGDDNLGSGLCGWWDVREFAGNAAYGQNRMSIINDPDDPNNTGSGRGQVVEWNFDEFGGTGNDIGCVYLPQVGIEEVSPQAHDTMTVNFRKKGGTQSGSWFIFPFDRDFNFYGIWNPASWDGLPADTWVELELDLTGHGLGGAPSVGALWFGSWTGGTHLGTGYIDEIVFVGTGNSNCDPFNTAGPDVNGDCVVNLIDYALIADDIGLDASNP